MARRQLPVDFKEFIDFLNKNEVEYLLVGGWAALLCRSILSTKQTGINAIRDLADAESLEGKTE